MKHIFSIVLLVIYILFTCMPLSSFAVEDKPLSQAEQERIKKNYLDYALLKELHAVGLDPDKIRKAYISYTNGNAIALTVLINEAKGIKAKEEQELKVALEEQMIFEDTQKIKLQKKYQSIKNKKNQDSKIKENNNIALIAPEAKKVGIAKIIPCNTDNISLKSFSADGQSDTAIQALVKWQNPLIAIRLESIGGMPASWNTKQVKASALGILAVAINGKIYNENNTPLELNVQTPTKLELIFQDNGAIAKKTRLRLIFYYKDGSRNYATVKYIEI